MKKTIYNSFHKCFPLIVLITTICKFFFSLALLVVIYIDIEIACWQLMCVQNIQVCCIMEALAFGHTYIVPSET